MRRSRKRNKLGAQYPKLFPNRTASWRRNRAITKVQSVTCFLSLAHCLEIVEDFYQHLTRSGPSGFVCLFDEPRLTTRRYRTDRCDFHTKENIDAKAYRRWHFGLHDFGVGNGS